MVEKSEVIKKAVVAIAVFIAGFFLAQGVVNLFDIAILGPIVGGFAGGIVGIILFE